MKEIDVRFDSGRDVLNAYWGYLSDGGLVISDRDGLAEGQPVSLKVHIASSDSRYLFAGKVVKRHDGAEGGQVVIAFRPGEPHDMLLTEALSETDNVPARRHRRYRLDIGARVRAGSAEGHDVRLINLSAGGCCLQLDEAMRGDYGVGARITIDLADIRLSGEVVWARHRDRGIRFESMDSKARGELEAYLGKL